jgi:cardiolipin synthase
LTYARVLAVPALVLCFYIESYAGRWLSFAVFMFATITDFFDGYLARAWHQQSAIGLMLDPIADKLLVGVALLLLVSDYTIGGWSLVAAIIILSREILVSGLREFLAEVRVRVPVSQLAKWKTTMQMVAIGFLICGPAGDRIFPYVSYIGLLLLWVSALLTLYTGYDYFRAGFRHLMSEDA